MDTCHTWISVEDDDDELAFCCQLPDGHDGPHVESFELENGQFVTVTWMDSLKTQRYNLPGERAKRAVAAKFRRIGWCISDVFKAIRGDFR
jgi:hypothetical protein